MLALIEITQIGLGFHYLELSFVIFLTTIVVYLPTRTWLIEKLGVELASGMDCLFSMESSQNKSLIVAAGIFDSKIDSVTYTKQIKKYVFSKGYERLRKILVKNPLCFYWKYTKGFVLEKHLRVEKKIHFKTYDEIYEFMGKELSDPEVVEGQPQWMVHLFENFGDNQSAFVLRFHHAMVDGIALMSLMLHISDNDYKIVKLPKLSFLHWILIYALFPFLGVYYFICMALEKKDVNCFHNKAISGKKKVYSSEPLELEKMKAVSRMYNCSINDLFVTVLMDTLNDFIKQTYGQSVKSLTQFIPFSLRGLPPPHTHVTFNNTMVPLFVKMPMKTDENKREMLRFYKAIFLKMKNSFEAPMVYLAIYLSTLILPPCIYKILIKSNISKPSCGFTNVPGPLNKLNFWGTNLGRLFFYVPTMGNIGLGFSLLTYANKLIISVQSDESIGFDGKKFTMNFLKNLEHYAQKAFEKESLDGSTTDFTHLVCECCKKLK